ncbi:DUF1338 domain-containing protein [bacterium]|nr:DUF1338 domain-containing protein [bacterium]
MTKINKSYHNALQIMLNGLMTRYKQRVPDVDTIINAMIQHNIISNEHDIINDHIAFRTFGLPHLGIQSLEKIMLAYGYSKKDFYRFETKKLTAYWYSPPSNIPNLPRLFISQCEINQLSKKTQAIINHYTQHITKDPVDTLDLKDGNAVDTFLHTPLWQIPTWEDYEYVLHESEYAAWVLYNRYYLNHFTITIQTLKKGYNTIELFNHFLESIGIKLNAAGGKIKCSNDKKLIQSSTVAKTLTSKFPHKNGKEQYHDIAGSYVEFAERIDNRDGFEVGNADKIFESTFTSEINK